MAEQRWKRIPDPEEIETGLNPEYPPLAVGIYGPVDGSPWPRISISIHPDWEFSRGRSQTPTTFRISCSRKRALDAWWEEPLGTPLELLPEIKVLVDEATAKIDAIATEGHNR